MQPAADVCLIVEGGYPYILGGVASWMDAFMRASPATEVPRDHHQHRVPAKGQEVRDPRTMSSASPTSSSTPVPRGAAPTRRGQELISTGVRLIQATFGGDREREL